MSSDQAAMMTSGVRTPPPLLYAFFIITGILFQKFYYLNPEFHGTVYSKIIGILCAMASLFFIFKGFNKFFKKKTTVLFSQPTSVLITSGIFGNTRNPIYVGFTFAYFGYMFLMGNWWHLILFPILFMIMQNYVIRKEENYLEMVFGQEYLDYKTKVSRWL